MAAEKAIMCLCELLLYKHGGQWLCLKFEVAAVMPKQKHKIGRVAKSSRAAAASQVGSRPTGRPRKYDDLHLKYMTYKAIAHSLWLPDYRPLVEAVIADHPAIAASITHYLESAQRNLYSRRLAALDDTALAEQYAAKLDVRLAELLEEIDGIASQKCRSVLKEAKGIAFKLQGISVSQVKAASYSGDSHNCFE